MLTGSRVHERRVILQNEVFVAADDFAEVEHVGIGIGPDLGDVGGGEADRLLFARRLQLHQSQAGLPQ